MVSARSVRSILRVTVFAAITATAWSHSIAADFAVTSGADDGSGGTMRWAIEQLNAAGAGSHSITFDDSINGISLTDNLPHIDATNMTVVINGFGCTLNGHDQHRLFFVAAGDVTILNFNLENGLAAGGEGGDGRGGGGGGAGMGGALFVNSSANVTINNVNFDSSSAAGGRGGDRSNAPGGGGGGGAGGDGGSADLGGGGGGGLFGDGGNTSFAGGGGGGGLLGDGGNSNSGGGGGGGGVLLPGGNSSGDFGGSGALTGGNGGDLGVPNGSNGGDGILGGGGGGGGEGFGGTGGNGGNGGTFGGGGGGAFSDLAGGSGGDGGVGGAFGGGGGAGVGLDADGTSGDGGFGGGGGGTPQNGLPGIGGFGGGDGGAENVGGGGGDGYGGAVFVRQGGTLTVIDSAITNNTVTAGNGGVGTFNGAAGTAAGQGMYLHTSVTANIQVSSGPGLVYADTIAGDGGINKTGTGTLTLSGNNTYTGDTTVSAGKLVVNGTITSDTTVDNGARLGGIGAVVGNVINAGQFEPGNSIGTFSINGDYLSNASSTLEIEFNSAGTVPGTNVDLVDVDGTAQLNGTLSLVAEPGSYVAGTQYTFLIADNGVNGTFSQVIENLAFLDVSLIYDPNSVSFMLVSNGNNYADLACTTNTFHVGTYLDDVAGSASGDLAQLLAELDMVTTDEACFALEQLSGAVYGSTAQIGVDSTSIYLQALARRLRSNLYDGDNSLAESASGAAEADVVYVSYTSTAAEPLVIHDCRTCRRRWNTWATGFGLGGDAQSDGNAAGLNYTLGGTLVGAETMSDTHLVGFYGGYAYNYVGTDANESSKTSGGLTGGYYVGRNDNQYYIAAGGFEFDGYDSRRQINFAGLTASGDTDGWKGYTYLERGATYGSRRLALQPFGGLQYIYVRQNGFTETGAAAANLAVPGIDANSLRSVLGSRVYATRTSRGGRLMVPELRALWLHEFLDNKTGFETTFASVGDGGFAINGLGLGRDWAMLGGGLNCDLGCGWSTYGDYDLMLNDRTTFHIGSGGVQYLW